MKLHLFHLEVRLLARERAAWVLSVLFALSLVYGLWNGARLDEQRRETLASLAHDAELFQAQLREYLGQQPVEPRAVAGRGALAVLPPAPLALLATGQSDLSPGHESIILWKLAAPADTRSELENPSSSLAGRFDLAFVLVWVYPLFLLALVYDLMAGDREAGTLRLALSQGIVPWRWMTLRALARALPIVALAAVATLATGFLGDSGGTSLRLGLALAVVFAYGMFWVALSMAVNAVARSAASAATVLGAAWVLLVMVAPTLLNATVETIYPTPSRPELVAAGRRASNETEKRGSELLHSFYRDHPELAPPGQQANFAALQLAVQSEVWRVVEPVRKKFDEQLARQQSAVGRWRFASPAIASYEAFTDLAGTGYWRYRAFREQVNAFKRTVSDFYTPKIHRREALTMADYDRLPRFIFREEPVGSLLGRVGAGLVGLLGLSGAVGVWAWRSLRPARIGRMTT